MDEQVEKLISVLSEESFNELIRCYAKHYYKVDEVNIINGPYDGGNDLMYFKNEIQVRKNVQITVQKTKLDQKIKQDIIKASKNVAENGYLSHLDFYLSIKMTPNKKNEYIRFAEINYGIGLKIIDASKIADDSIEFGEVRDLVYKLHGVEVEDEIKVDKKTRVLFNMLTLGDDTVNLKKEFVHASILMVLYESPYSDVNFVFEKLSVSLPAEYDKAYYKNRLDFLKSQDKVFSNKNRYCLTKSAKKDVIRSFKHASVEETNLRKLVGGVLERHELNDILNDVLLQLAKLYKEHFKFEIDEINKAKSSYFKGLQRVLDELINMLKRKGVNSKIKREEIANDLINLCNENDYLQKIGMSYMYINLLNSNKLDQYINKGEKILVFDTQILLRLLLSYSKHKVEYENIKYMSTKHFLDQISNSDLEIDLQTYNVYIDEVLGQIMHALRLQYFLELPIFNEFSDSDNIFFNFWKKFQKTNPSNKIDSLSDFIIIELLGLKSYSLGDAGLKKSIRYRLVKIFEHFDINVIPVKFKNDSYVEIKKNYEIILYDKVRSRRSISRDVQAAMFLGDKLNRLYQENVSAEVYFITWGFSFYELRDVVSKTDGFAPWFVYTPLKFSEKLDLINFKINPKSVNYGLIYLVESKFNEGNSDISFLDLMELFFEKEDLGKMELAHKIANLEERLLKQKPSDQIRKDQSPLIHLLRSIHLEYNKKDSEKNLKDVMNIFNQDILADNIYDLIKNELEVVKRNGTTSKSFYMELNKLMSQ